MNRLSSRQQRETQQNPAARQPALASHMNQGGTTPHPSTPEPPAPPTPSPESRPAGKVPGDSQAGWPAGRPRLRISTVTKTQQAGLWGGLDTLKTDSTPLRTPLASKKQSGKIDEKLSSPFGRQLQKSGKPAAIFVRCEREKKSGCFSRTSHLYTAKSYKLLLPPSYTYQNGVNQLRED